MKLNTDWRAIRRGIEAVLHPLKDTAKPGTTGSGDGNREWVVVYRTAHGFCCMYKGVPVVFEDMLEIENWAEEMDVQPYFMGI